MLHRQKVIVVVLEALYESQLLHSHEILLRKAEFVFIGGIEFVDVCSIPPKLIVGDIEFNFLARNVKMRRIGDGNKINRIDLIPIPKEDSIDEHTLLILSQTLFSLSYLIGGNLHSINNTSFFVFFLFTMYSFNDSAMVSFYPCRMATVFLLPIIRICKVRS